MIIVCILRNERCNESVWHVKLEQVRERLDEREGFSDS